MSHFTAQVLGGPTTSSSRSGPFKPNRLSWLLQPREARRTTFPRVPRDSRARALGKLRRPSLKPAGHSHPASASPPLLSVSQSELRHFGLCVCRRQDSWPRRCDSTGGWYWSPARGEVSMRKPEGGRRSSCCTLRPPFRLRIPAQPELHSWRRGCGQRWGGGSRRFVETHWTRWAGREDG